MFGDISLEDRKHFVTLLYIDAIRGHHSTGVANVSLHREVDVHKKALTALDFLDSKRGTAVIDKVGCGLLGHNRYATVGTVNSENAHPFTHGKITGMHNGTLTRQNLLPDHTKFDVDSENIIYAIDKDGADATIPKIAGAAALTWWNEEEKSFHFWRNTERTLYYVMSTDNRTMYWASEVGMLQMVINSDRRKDKKVFGKIYVVTSERLYDFKFTHKDGITFGSKEVKCAPKFQTTYPGGSSTTHITARTTQAKYVMYRAVEVENLRKAVVSGVYSPNLLEGNVVGDKKATVRVPWRGSMLTLEELLEDGLKVVGTINSVASSVGDHHTLYVLPSSLTKKKQTTH
jgi:predicted glutamine amidotransferase